VVVRACHPSSPASVNRRVTIQASKGRRVRLYKKKITKAQRAVEKCLCGKSNLTPNTAKKERKKMKQYARNWQKIFLNYESI
jgi:ATP-dependent exoDNAse (exonuclease V) alpha subunit